MKKLFKISISILITILMLNSCKEKELTPATPAPSTSEVTLPEKFKVSIPNSLSYSTSSKAGVRLEAGTSGKTDGGAAIYEPLRQYILVGEAAAKLVEDIILNIKKYKLSKSQSFVFTSDVDNRIKKLEVKENISFEGTKYQYMLNLTDTASKSVGLQVFWNISPVKGVAILNFYNLERIPKHEEDKNAQLRVDYDETASDGYEKRMIVYASGLSTRKDPQAPIGLKMFAGLKANNIVEIYGNSAHENVSSLGLGAVNYAFRAKGHIVDELGVAEVSLPPSSLTGTAGMMADYSVKNTLIALVKKTYNLTSVPDDIVGNYLTNFDAPGYFQNEKFIGAGTFPSSITGFNSIKDLSLLTPYVPKDIATLKVEFMK